MAQHRNRPTIYHQGDLRIIVPNHAQQRVQERGDIQPLLPASLRYGRGTTFRSANR